MPTVGEGKREAAWENGATKGKIQNPILKLQRNFKSQASRPSGGQRN
jgi:hypothetical protein